MWCQFSCSVVSLFAVLNLLHPGVEARGGLFYSLLTPVRNMAMQVSPILGGEPDSAVYGNQCDWMAKEPAFCVELEDCPSSFIIYYPRRVCTKGVCCWRGTIHDAEYDDNMDDE